MLWLTNGGIFKMNDHYCPGVSPNKNILNFRASNCVSRIKAKTGNCAMCTSGVGYVAPVKKVITERLWRSPEEKKKKNYPRKKKLLADSVYRPSNCGCGNKRELGKTYCEDCRVKNLAVAVAKTRLKFLLKQRDRLNTKIANVRELIKN